MFFRFLPRDVNFFDLFDKQVKIAVEAAVYFREIVSKDSLDIVTAEKMKDIEHQGDKVAHSVIEHLNKTFITPFDREDIHALAVEIDDIIDMIHTIVSRLRVYKLSGDDKHLIKFALIIEQSARAVELAVNGLRNQKNSKVVTEACTEIKRLENVGNMMRDEALGELFEKVKDPLAVIKWKEIYQAAETVLDICEDVTHVVGAILVKQA